MSATARLMCLGGCGYALSTPLARARGYGHRCWDKLPAATQAAITDEIRPPRPPAKPRRTKRRTAATPPGPGQLQLTDDPTTEETAMNEREHDYIEANELSAADRVEPEVHAPELDANGNPTDYALCGADGKLAYNSGRVTCPDCLGWYDRETAEETDA